VIEIEIVEHESRKMTLVDLSYTLSEDDKSIWPGNLPFRKTVISDHSDNCIMASYDISMNEHVGTHMDAPYHFCREGWTTEQIPLEKLVNIPGVVVDISHKTLGDPEAKLEEEDLLAWVSENGDFPDNCLVLMRSGWGQYYYSDPAKFLGTNQNDMSRLQFPGFGKSGIDWLLEKTSLVGIGVDTLSIELGTKQECYVHRTLTRHNKYGVECLANLQLLPPRGFTVTVLPLKIQGGSGGPCRAVATIH